jgi:signal transduction histidine kinase
MALLVVFAPLVFVLIWISLTARNHTLAVLLIVVVTGIFGYIVAQLTLAPARHALTSQKEFIGNIAHELRTPLSIIKTNTEVALIGVTVSPEMRETLDGTIEELDRASEIINNLLSLSNLTRPGRIPFASVDLSELAGNVVRKHEELARRMNLRVTVRQSPDSYVWGNATALEQVLGNLIKNAIYYTPSGGQIIITVAPHDANMIELIVQDSGIGISRADLFRIFEPFYRSDQSRARRELSGRHLPSGSGLGLAIVSELLKLHQARIMIKSALGRGTTVTALIPAARHHSGGGADTGGFDQIMVDFSRNV